MRLLISILLAGLTISCAALPAQAQSQSQVVAVCGTLPLAYAPGAVRTDTIDVNGNKCTAGTVTISGGATAANQTLQITQETAINTLLGLQADAACATDNGTCTLAALVKRLNQRLTTLNTTLGSPFQAGGSIGNTGFIANAGTNLNTSALALDATVGTTNTNLGAPGATACATDTGSCSGNALLQRLAQRLTTVNTTLGTPFQAGASIGNTTFASTIADGADVALGTTTDAAATQGSTGTVSAKLRTATGQLNTLNTTVALAANQTVTQAPVAPATATATKSDLVGCQATTAAVNPTTGQQGACSSDTNNNILVSAGGAPNLAVSQVSVTTSDTAVVSARALRRSVTIQQITGTQNVFCNQTTATAANGIVLPAVVGASFTLNTTSAIRCIAITGAQTVAIAETY